jgi:hypothetical protein
MPRHQQTPLDVRFDAKWIPEPNSGCWLWTAAIGREGYGRLGRGTRAERTETAHRISWILANGDVPPGLAVCHRCAVPLCVNPAHLFLATKAEYGERCSRAGLLRRPALTPDAVRNIRSSNRSDASLAAELRVSEQSIYRARRRMTWRTVA